MSAISTAAVAQAVTLSPTTLSWASSQVGQTSSAKSVTLTNTQGVPLTISSISVPAGSDFIISATTCPLSPSTVAASGTCTISAEFRPLASGARSNTVTITDDAPGSPQTIGLSGNGAVGTVLFSPTSVSFSTPVGTTSAAQSVTLTNTQSSAITLTAIKISAPFVQSNNCPLSPNSLAANATCTFSVTYQPTAAGTPTGFLTVTDASGSVTASTQLYLSGSAAAPTVTVSPTSANFGSVQLGAQSSPQVFTFANGSSSAVTISSISTTLSDYSVSTTCPVSPNTLAATSNCSISVTFAPTTTGTRADTLTVANSAPGSPETPSLTGTGTAVPSGITFSPTSLSWASIQVGQTSGAKTLTMTNNSASAVTITAMAVGSEFLLNSTTCPGSASSLAAGASCTVSVSFQPHAQGARSDNISFTDNGPGSPQTVPVSGTGSVGPALFSPTTLAFPSTPIGSTSASQSATFTNQTAAALTLSSITSSSNFVQTNNCPTSLAANASCTFSVAFTPTPSSGPTGGITVNDGSGTLQLYLSGTSSGGTSNGGSVTWAPKTYVFPNESIGYTSNAATVTLTNGQSVALNISSIQVGSPFAETDNCTTPLAAGAACSINITFSPSATGFFSSTLTITDDASNSPQTVAVSGNGVAPVTTVPTAGSTYAFPNDTVGSSSESTTVSVINNQPVALNFSSIQIAAPFSQTNTCGSSLAANSSCTITIVFAPTSVGFFSSSLVIADSASNSPQNIAITGDGVAPVTTVPVVGGLYFNNQIVQTSSTPLAVTFTNNQSTTLNISSISTTADYPISTNCLNGGTTGTLAAGATCTVEVSFVPQATGQRTANLTMVDSAASGSPLNVPLSGLGIAGTPGLTVNVKPTTPCALPSQSVPFNALVTGTSNTAVTWWVDNIQGGNATVGKITTAGVYTPPGNTGSHVIKAVSQVSNSADGTTAISVTTAPSFEIYPFVAAIPPGGQQTFQPQICFVPDTGSVSYSVDNIVGGNATVGTVSSTGVYTAPAVAGKHTVRVTDLSLNKTSGGVVTVFASISADFGSRTNTNYPIPANMFGSGRGEAVHSVSDRNLLTQAGLNEARLYAQIQLVYATQTPDWTQIDPLIASVQAAGQHPILQLSLTPPWLQPNPNPCGAGNNIVAPADVNKWAQIASSYVAHMDSAFPGFVQDYEIWNEPNSLGMCSNNHLNSYIALYAAAAPAMKAQAAADGQTIRVGGPVLSAYSALWLNTLLTTTSTAPYVDFVSYHQYIYGSTALQAQWDTFTGDPSLYEATQDPSNGAAATYNKTLAAVAAGNQPLGAKTPIYITEFNTNWAFFQDCCRNDANFGPVWNSMYVSDVMNSVYNGASVMPNKLIYFASNAYPWFCIIGVLDTNMDCLYSAGATPVPYPQYYTYQLLAGPNYLGLGAGGYMAASITPPSGGGGLISTAFYTSTQDAILITNPTSTAYSQIPVTFANSGFNTPTGTLYQVDNGASINSSSVALTQQGTTYTTTISVPAYSVQAVALKGP